MWHHKNGMVPKFFAMEWGQKHGEDPYDNELRCERVSSKWSRLMFWVIMCFAVAMIMMLLYGKGLVQIYWCLVALVPGVAFLIAASCIKDPPADYQEFNSSVRKLFQAFNISPSKEIGAMSREEFITAIAGSLRTAAKAVDAQEGFERVAAMNEWKEMHAEALKWGLCKEGYETYFPQKKD